MGGGGGESGSFNETCSESERSMSLNPSEIMASREEVDSFGEIARLHSFISSSPSGFPPKRRNRVREQLMQSYQNAESKAELLKEAKNMLLNYQPGAWLEEVGGVKRTDYEIPKTTTLLLIGPRGSGKSSLVNRISRVLESGRFLADRAQVSYGLSAGEGTCFLQEYMIPRDSNSICAYDTRSLSKNFDENSKLLKNWMTNGVEHGQKIVRYLDDKSTRSVIRRKARHLSHPAIEKRMVNSVILVVDAMSVLKSMTGEDPEYISLVTKTFNCPYLSFRDDKPAVVLTHGDEIPCSIRTEIRIYLGERLGIPPHKQIFDIPDNSDAVTDLAVLDLLLYSLQHADRNLPLKLKPTLTKLQNLEFRLIAMMLVLLLATLLVHVTWDRYHQSWHQSKWSSMPPSARVVWKAIRPSGRKINWSKIRHLWLGK